MAWKIHIFDVHLQKNFPGAKPRTRSGRGIPSRTLPFVPQTKILDPPATVWAWFQCFSAVCHHLANFRPAKVGVSNVTKHLSPPLREPWRRPWL
jgi:hypothetical protein